MPIANIHPRSLSILKSAVKSALRRSLRRTISSNQCPQAVTPVCQRNGRLCGCLTGREEKVRPKRIPNAAGAGGVCSTSDLTKDFATGDLCHGLSAADRIAINLDSWACERSARDVRAVGERVEACEQSPEPPANLGQDVIICFKVFARGLPAGEFHSTCPVRVGVLSVKMLSEGYGRLGCRKIQ